MAAQSLQRHIQDGRTERYIPPPTEGARYEYKALPIGWIRLVVLMPGECEPKFALVSVPLDDVDDQYDALSYTWGEPEPRLDVPCISGGRITVTPNLYDALRALRQDVPRRMWIDQLSINQQDLDERGEQVQMMGSIYGCARNVIVWLGQKIWSDDEFQADFSLLLDVANQWALGEVEEMSPAQRREADKLPRRAWDSLSRALSNDYFVRRWIIQEVSKARRIPLFACGGSFRDFDDLQSVAFYIQDCYVPEYAMSLDLRLACHSLMILDWLSEQLTDKKTTKDDSITLMQLMVRTRSFKGADPRDMVYSVLGLLESPSQWQHVTVDYTIPFEKLWRSVSLHALLEQSDTELLRFCRLSDAEDWPSWVLHPIPDILTPTFVESSDQYDASKGKVSNITAIRGRPDNLQFKTRCLGKITHISSYYVYPEDQGPNIRHLEIPPMAIYDYIASQMAFVFADRTEVTDLEFEHFASVLLFDIWDDRLSSADPDQQMQAFAAVRDRWPQDEQAKITAQLRLARSCCEQSNFMRLCRIDPAPALVGCVQMPFLGWVPREAVCGDHLYVIYGFEFPMLVREVESKRFTFGGVCYAHGMMDGQALEVDGGEDAYIEVV